MALVSDFAIFSMYVRQTDLFKRKVIWWTFAIFWLFFIVISQPLPLNILQNSFCHFSWLKATSISEIKSANVRRPYGIVFQFLEKKMKKPQLRRAKPLLHRIITFPFSPMLPSSLKAVIFVHGIFIDVSLSHIFETMGVKYNASCQ